MIRCPHCEGTARWPVDAEREEDTSYCKVCGNNNIGEEPDGMLSLPLPPDHAEAIYELACECCSGLVNQEWRSEGQPCCAYSGERACQCEALAS